MFSVVLHFSLIIESLGFAFFARLHFENHAQILGRLFHGFGFEGIYVIPNCFPYFMAELFGRRKFPVEATLLNFTLKLAQSIDLAGINVIRQWSR